MKNELWIKYLEGLVTDFGSHFYIAHKTMPVEPIWIGFVQCGCYNDKIPGALVRIHENYVEMLDLREVVHPDKTWRKEYDAMSYEQKLRTGSFGRIFAADPDFETKFKKLSEYHQILQEYLGIKEDDTAVNYGMMAGAARA